MPDETIYIDAMDLNSSVPRIGTVPRPAPNVTQIFAPEFTYLINVKPGGTVVFHGIPADGGPSQPTTHTSDFVVVTHQPSGNMGWYTTAISYEEALQNRVRADGAEIDWERVPRVDASEVVRIAAASQKNAEWNERKKEISSLLRGLRDRTAKAAQEKAEDNAPPPAEKPAAEEQANNAGSHPEGNDLEA